MNDAESKLIREMRTVAASHRRDGERRTADLLERAAEKIERLLNSGKYFDYEDVHGGSPASAEGKP